VKIAARTWWKAGLRKRGAEVLAPHLLMVSRQEGCTRLRDTFFDYVGVFSTLHCFMRPGNGSIPGKVTDSSPGRFCTPVRVRASNEDMLSRFYEQRSGGSEASSVDCRVWRRRLDLACGTTGCGRRILRMHQCHLTCMVMEGDRDWCGFGRVAELSTRD